MENALSKFEDRIRKEKEKGGKERPSVCGVSSLRALIFVECLP